MAAQSGANEGFQVVEEFICQAIPAPGIRSATSLGSGVNVGAQVVSEYIVSTSCPSLSKEREAELRALSNRQLLELLQLSGSKLNAAELAVIHDIAIERLTRKEDPFFEGAENLLREVMRITLKRIA